MEYHCVCEAVDRIGGGFTEWSAVNGGHDVGGLIADVFGEAEVLVSSVVAGSASISKSYSLLSFVLICFHPSLV